MKKVKYNNIGKTYNKTRRADDRIVGKLIELINLPKQSSLLDVGAGTGNYSFELAKSGYKVFCLEPSEVMIEQGRRHMNITWKEGFAENIPFGDKLFDAAICILSTHHFSNLEKAIKEINRVIKKDGKVIIFTADPRLCSEIWIYNYFKNIIKKSYKIHPKINDFKELIQSVTGKSAIEERFLLPRDLEDGFFFSAWRYPEKYLDKKFRDGISSFSETPEKLVKDGIIKLKNDLENGNWRLKYGEILELSELDCGYRFLIF